MKFKTVLFFIAIVFSIRVPAQELPIRIPVRIYVREGISYNKDTLKNGVLLGTNALQTAIVQSTGKSAIQFIIFDQVEIKSPEQGEEIDPQILGPKIPRGKNEISIFFTNQKIKIKNQRYAGFSRDGWSIMGLPRFGEAGMWPHYGILAAHEIGHLFWLDHSPINNSVMFRKVNEVTTLSYNKDDFERLRSSIKLVTQNGFETLVK